MNTFEMSEITGINTMKSHRIIKDATHAVHEALRHVHEHHQRRIGLPSESGRILCLEANYSVKVTFKLCESSSKPAATCE